MAVVFLDSFDHYKTAQMLGKWDAVQLGIVQSGVTRCAVGQAYQAGPNGFGTLTKNVPAQTTYTVGFGFQINGAQGADDGLLGFNDASGIQMELRLNVDGTLSLYRQFTLVATSTYTYPSGAWHYLEMQVFVDGTVGTATVKVDSTTVLTFSGNTKGSATSSITIIHVISNLLGPLNTHYVDDLYICDATNTSGAGNTGFLGPQKLVALFPRAAGSNSAFVPTPTQANYLNVRENLPGNDADATYNASAVDGDIDSFLLDLVPYSSGTLTAVQQNLVARYDDGGPHVLKGYVKSGSATALSADISSPSNYGTSLHWVEEVDPNTGAKFDIPAFNFSEWGYKRVS